MGSGGGIDPHHPMAALASLEGLPDDALAHVFELLVDVNLVRLRQVSRRMNARVSYLFFQA
jgi:hypothetical protein